MTPGDMMYLAIPISSQKSVELPFPEYRGSSGIRQVGGNALRERPRHDPGNLLDAGRAQLRDAAEAPQQFLCCARADARDIFKASLNRALCASLAVKTHGEAMGFVANQLD